MRPETSHGNSYPKILSMMSTINQTWIYRANTDLKHQISTVWSTTNCYTLWKRQFHGCNPFQKNQELERRCYCRQWQFTERWQVVAMVFWKADFCHGRGGDGNVTAPKGGKMSPDLTLHWSHGKEGRGSHCLPGQPTGSCHRWLVYVDDVVCQASLWFLT